MPVGHDADAASGAVYIEERRFSAKPYNALAVTGRSDLLQYPPHPTMSTSPSEPA
jgi:hypothetical protein